MFQNPHKTGMRQVYRMRARNVLNLCVDGFLSRYNTNAFEWRLRLLYFCDSISPCLEDFS